MADTVKQLVEKVKELWDEYRADEGPLQRIKFRSVEDILKNIDSFSRIVNDVISLTELASEVIEDVQSGDKLDAAVDLLDDMLKLPWYLEIADGMVIKVILSYAVNLINKSKEGRLSVERAKLILADPVDRA